MSTALILGAGFSYVAGLPLAGNLLETPGLVSSIAAGQRFEPVWDAWSAWSARNPAKGSEQFLEAVFHKRINVPWAHAVELVGVVLATPRGDDWPAIRNPRYAGRVGLRVKCEAHRSFWQRAMAQHEIGCVVTTNYDILAERGLRHRAFPTTGLPGFHYGGFPKPQVLVGLAHPSGTQSSMKKLELTGSVPVFKLHGSLNWSMQDGEVLMYQDLRPAFRHGGTALIVPPLPEKEAPPWLSQVWKRAEEHLASCATWIVCGYSLPPYDLAIQAMFRRAGVKVKHVGVMDPYALEIAERWQSVAPDAQVHCHEGLPGGIDAAFGVSTRSRGTGAA